MGGPVQAYLAQYNGYRLPGYVQQESSNSNANIGNHQAPYADGSLSEYTGLTNKNLTLRLKVWEGSFLQAREKVQKAATYLRTNREDFAPLYVQFPDRYYEALVTKISSPREAGQALKIREYTVEFEAKPWLTSVAVSTLIGTGTLSTGTRTLEDGGWTPTTITVTGTNVTISGYTEDGKFAGFISIDGSVSNLVIDTENQSAYTVSGASMIDRMLWADFSMYVGPNETTFVVTGATNCQIDYRNRWYI